MSHTPVSSLGQFLMARTVSQAYLVASSIQPINEYDQEVINKVLEQNWETEEQMVSNLLLCPYLIPEPSRLKYLLKGLENPAHPYYSVCTAVGAQSLPQLAGNSTELLTALRKSTFSEHGLVSMRAFVTLQPYLSYPKDVEFIMNILQKHKSSLFGNSLLWLLQNVKDRAEIKEIIQSDKFSPKGKNKASKIIEDYFADIDEGKHADNCLETLDFIPNFEDFDAMLDKEETLSDFFVDIDTNKDGKVSFQEIVSFLEDIGKKIDVDSLRREVEGLESDNNGLLGKDDFIELMFPKFQIV